MIIDIHTHIIGLESGRQGNYLAPPRRLNLLLRLLLNKMLRDLPDPVTVSPHEGVLQVLGEWVNASAVDRVVMLALDGAYRRDGTPDLEHTQFIAGNDYVAGFAARHPKVLFGASIHPYRKDALEELDRVVERGACLVKWLPAAQNIAPDDPACFPFYERLAHHGLPLLSHTGVEHTLAKFPDALSDPERLVPALERGVTVIAAHCGTRIYLYERSRFAQWARLAKEYPNFYGDLSAFGLPMHGGALRQILADPALTDKVVYGSDFPIPSWPFWYLGWLGWRKALRLRGISNPYDKVFRIMQGLGVPDEVFHRGAKLLRLPAAQAMVEGDTR